MSVNVRDYGAGNGNPWNDTQGIRDAITAVQNGSDRTLYFPRGTYYINDTISFAPWSDYFTGYVVDFGGSTIVTSGLAPSVPALNFFDNKLLTVRGLRLQGNQSTDAVGIVIDSLQPNGFDLGTFEHVYVNGFQTGWRIGSPNNRVASVDFRVLGVEGCAVGIHIDGLVDRCRFGEVAVSAATEAGFKVTHSGALTFENCTGYGDFPLFLLDGPVHELAFSGCQNESPNTQSNFYFMKRLQSGSGNGVPRPMVISNCTIEAPITLGNPGSQTGGATQAIFVGCTISREMYIQFYDYYVELFGCYVVPGTIINVQGAGSKLTAFGSKLGSGNVSVTGPGAQYRVALLGDGAQNPAY